jgi:hypothetical protein
MSTSLRRPARGAAPQHQPTIDTFRGQHLALAQRQIATELGHINVTVDDAESPLAHQLLAGERLRADFTRAHLMPRTTANWESPISSDRRGGAGAATDTMIAARQRVNQALDAAGPEFAGLLVDICCFLKGLEDIERSRAWPTRSAKIVLQLALDRLARFYGYAAKAKGPGQAAIRTWLADDTEFKVDSV